MVPIAVSYRPAVTLDQLLGPSVKELAGATVSVSMALALAPVLSCTETTILLNVPACGVVPVKVMVLPESDADKPVGSPVTDALL